MVIRYNHYMGWLLLISGAFLVLLGVIGAGLANGMFSLVAGVVVLPLSVIYLTKPWLTVEDDSITFMALIESKRTTYPGRPKVDGNMLVTGDGTKIGRKMVAHPADWAKLVEKYGQGD